MEPMDSEDQKVSPISQLLDMLDMLEAAGIYYRLRYSTPRAISVDIALPDARWELDYFEDGKVYIEKLVSQGGVGGSSMMAELEDSIGECLRERKETGQDNGVDAG